MSTDGLLLPPLAWAALGLLTAVLLIVLWLLGVRWFYRLREPRPEPFQIACADGWKLTLYHRAPAVRRFTEPVILVHGLAANHYTFDFDPPYSLAHVLADAGFECFSVDLRGTGRSAKPPRWRSGEWTVDDHVALDAPAMLDAVCARTGASRVLWVGHSLGALVGYALAQGPAAARLSGLVALGAPVFFRYAPWMRLAIALGTAAAWPLRLRHTVASIALAPFLGYVRIPFSEVVANTHHIAPRTQRQVYAHLMSALGRRVLSQFRDWAANDAWRSADRKTDWRAGLERLDVPLLVMGGRADGLATPAAVEAQFELAGSADKSLVLLGKQDGMAMDYGHGDLLYGKGVPAEVHPPIRDWLIAHATPCADASRETSDRHPGGSDDATGASHAQGPRTAASPITEG